MNLGKTTMSNFVQMRWRRLVSQGVANKDAFMNIVVPRFAPNAALDAPKCAECEEPMERIHRTMPMRVLIGSKRYHCRYCRRAYLEFCGKLFSLWS